MVRRALAALCMAFGILGVAAPAAADGDRVARVELTGVIDQVNAAFIEEALRAASAQGSAAVVLEVDSPGGELTSMDRILKAVLGSEVPVIAWVGPEGARAGSAATFVVLAADVNAMAPSTNIGAASVVTGTGEDLPETLGNKVTNDAVARIRALAEAQERNADWAESAVRDAASVDAREAVGMEPPVVDLLVADIPSLLEAVDVGERADGHAFTFEDAPLPALADLPVVDIEMNVGQQFLHALSDANIAFILFTIGFYGIIAEFFYANGFSGVIGGIALILAFIGSNALPLNIGGLLLVAVGVVLLALESQIASYGLLTIGGIVAFVLGAFALWTGVDTGELQLDLTVSPWLIGAVVAAGLVFTWFVVRAMLQLRRGGTLANRPVTSLVGSLATAQTLIAPRGIAYAGGESWSARSRDAEIRPGMPVRVVDVEGLELIVEPAPGGDGASTEE